MTNLDHLFCGPCPSPSCQRMVAGQKEGYLQLYPLQAAVMAVGPLVLFPGLIVESWQGVSIEPLKLAPNWGSIKQCPPGSLVGCPGPWRRTKVEPNVGSLAAAPMASLSLQSSSFHASAAQCVTIRKKTRSKRSVRENVLNVDPLT